jgi:hypothetical protein
MTRSAAPRGGKQLQYAHLLKQGMQFVIAPDDKSLLPTTESERTQSISTLSHTSRPTMATLSGWNAYLLETNRRPEDEATAAAERRRRAGIT